VDVTSVVDMGVIELAQTGFHRGAVPFKQDCGSPLAAVHAQALVEACHLIGGPQCVTQPRWEEM
jgi:hypothetical protein